MLIMKLRHSYSIDYSPGLKIAATVGGFLAPCKQLLFTVPIIFEKSQTVNTKIRDFPKIFSGRVFYGYRR